MKNLGTSLQFSTAYHPQTDGQTDRINQVLEDMLRACVLNFKGSWKKFLPFVEFAYNNSYQSSIGMALNEVRFGRKCRTPLLWDESGPAKLSKVEIQEQSEAIVQ